MGGGFDRKRNDNEDSPYWNFTRAGLKHSFGVNVQVADYVITSSPPEHLLSKQQFKTTVKTTGSGLEIW